MRRSWPIAENLTAPLPARSGAHEYSIIKEQKTKLHPSLPFGERDQQSFHDQVKPELLPIQFATIEQEHTTVNRFFEVFFVTSFALVKPSPARANSIASMIIPASQVLPFGSDKDAERFTAATIGTPRCYSRPWHGNTKTDAAE